MPKKNSPTKQVHSFRLSLDCVRQLKGLSGNMGRSDGDVVEVAVDRMYREEIRFGSVMITWSFFPIRWFESFQLCSK